jgi:hypothetical protein
MAINVALVKYQLTMPPNTIATQHHCHQTPLPPNTIATKHHCHQTPLTPNTIDTKHHCQFKFCKKLATMFHQLPIGKHCERW